MDHAAPEAALAHELELGLHAFGQRPLPTPDKDRVQEQVTLVDQSGAHGLSRQLGPAHAQVTKICKSACMERFPNHLNQANPDAAPTPSAPKPIAFRVPHLDDEIIERAEVDSAQRHAGARNFHQLAPEPLFRAVQAHDDNRARLHP